MSTHLILDGQGVFLKRLQCFSYGKKRGYKVFCEYDGFEIAPFEDFWELDKMLEGAGWGKPAYSYSRIIELPDIHIVLAAHENSYRVDAVYKADGKTQVTRDEVIEAQRVARAENNAKMRELAAKPPSVLDSFKAARLRKEAQEREAKRAEMDKRFGHGASLIQWQLNENPYSLMELGGEYVLRHKPTNLRLSA